MGCFLGCFGLSKKRKRRKPAIGPLIPNQRHVNYEPLDSDSELKVKPKERSILKIRKKVSFNLNVEVYEPVQPDYHLLKEDEEEEFNDEGSGQEDAKQTLLLASDSTTYPSNHRYQNCIDSYDEDYEDEEDDDDRDIDDDNYDGGGSDESTRQDEFSGQSNSSSVDELGDEDRVSNQMPLCEVKVNPLGSSLNVWDRRHYVQPVLNPVQNLSQWKAIKSRAAAAAAAIKHPRKENVVASDFLPFSFGPEANQNQFKPWM